MQEIPALFVDDMVQKKLHPAWRHTMRRAHLQSRQSMILQRNVQEHRPIHPTVCEIPHRSPRKTLQLQLNAYSNHLRLNKLGNAGQSMF